MSRSIDDVLHHLAAGPRAPRLRHVHRVPPRVGDPVALPEWISPELTAALAGAGIARLWSHQLEAADAAHAGEHVVISTGTASGKSLAFQLPALSAVLDGVSAPSGRGASVLYLAPTKALAQDQVAGLTRWALPRLRCAVLDGDTDPQERRWIRDHAAYVLTNPDLLHHSLLPRHTRWAPFLRALRYVVVDECHVYRGVFGSHVALVLRRLRRVASRYGASPTFVLASATVGDPAGHAARLVGVPMRAVTRDGSPSGGLVVAMWEPPAAPSYGSPMATSHGSPVVTSTGPPSPGCRSPRSPSTDPTAPDDDPGVDDEGPSPAGMPSGRRSAPAESAELLADLVTAGVQTVTFTRSRVAAEAVAAAARRRIDPTDPDCVPVVTYRGGYLPEERRELERQVRSGQARGVAATTALELGIDVSGLDAVVMAGWPGSRTALWQRIGRAGRAGRDALAILVAADDPLDTYLMRHPEAVLQRDLETAILDPGNPHVLTPHLVAAAAEHPLSRQDLELFGPPAPAIVSDLVAARVLRRRPGGWFWPRPDSPEPVALRGMGTVVRIVDSRTGRVLGTVDEGRAHTAVHTGAVYLHRGETWLVTALDLDDRVALAVRGDPGWTTHPRSVTTVALAEPTQTRRWGSVACGLGPVEVRSQVTSFRRRARDGSVIGEHPLELPERCLETVGAWWTLTEDSLLEAGLDPARWPGGLHAAEHAAIGILPLVAMADRWDVGGVSTARHPDTGQPTIVVYDGYPAGAGFAARGFDVMRDWLTATREAILGCRCSGGCPSCVQSPKCGNGNEPLDKQAASRVLAVTLTAAGDHGT